MSHFEIIIIGGGPAGLNAAKILGDAGKKVLLLEKNPEIGPKICAGGLTRKSVRYLNLPEELIDFSYDKIEFLAPRVKTTLRLGENFFFTIDRKKLGQWQLEKLNRNFVEVRTNARVKKIEPGNIELESGEKISFDYLIGADGSNSIVRRHLKLKTKYVGVAIQHILPKENFPKMEFHLDSRLFHSWYAWIFPHRDYVSLGYGYPGKYLNSVRMEKNFQKWIRKNQIDLSKSRRESFAINCDYRGFQFKNIFLAGDAAGLASGYTGEGIYQALISGEEIAKIILEKNYRPKKIKALLRERAIHHLFLRIVIFSGPFRNLIFDFVALCIKNKFLGRTLMRIMS